MSKFIDRIIKQETTKLFKQKYGEFAIKAISDRAVISIDGLKPVHRRTVYAMNEEGLVSNKKMKKSLHAVSATLRYHPHGDSSVYGALVRMAQSWKQNNCLIEFNGNSGSVYDSKDFAAFRYTYSRLSETAMAMLEGIEKNAVDILPSNGDEDSLEPVVLPSKFPALFVNGTMGIGVGLTSNIPPHNVNNVIKMIDAYIEDENISLDELFNILQGPEFPVDSVIMNKNELLKIYQTGRGRIVTRGKYEIDGDKIIFTSLPYNVDIKTILEALEKLGEKNSLPDVVDFVNESTTKDGIKLTFTLKKGSNPNDTLTTLFAKTSLKKTFSCSFYVLINGLPKLMNLKELVAEYVAHLRRCLIRESQFDADKYSAELHINEGYEIVLGDIDKAIEIIRGSLNKEFAKIELMNYFGISEIQAVKVLELRLARLTSMEIDKIKDLISELRNKIAVLEETIKSKEIQGGIISKNLSKFSNRKEYLTLLEDELSSDNEVISVQKEEVLVFLTKDGIGYGSLDIKNKDIPSDVLQVVKTDTHSQLYLVTEEGKLDKIHTYEIQSITSKISKLTPVSPNTIGFFTDETKYASYITELGVVRSLLIEEYNKKRVTVFTKLKSKDKILKVVNSEGTVVVIMNNGNRIFVDSIGEKNTVGNVYCGEAPVDISTLSEEYVIITNDGRCRKTDVEINIVKGKSKGLTFSAKTNENEEIVAIMPATEPCLVDGKMIDLDTLSNRFKKV